jgi:transposase
MSDNFRLSDAQWAVIAPLLPMVQTGPVRQDDRRIISGVLYRLRPPERPPRVWRRRAGRRPPWRS